MRLIDRSLRTCGFLDVETTLSVSTSRHRLTLFSSSILQTRLRHRFRQIFYLF